MSKMFKPQLIGMLILIGFVGRIQILFSQDEAVAWFNRGAKAASTQEKITCYLQAIKLNPKFIEAYYNLGYVYKNLGNYIDAEKAFRQALLTDATKLNNEEKLRINYELGITLKKLDRYQEALEILENAKNLAQQTEIRAEVLYELGRTKLLIGDFDGALAEFNEGMQLKSSKQTTFQAAIQNATMLREIETYYMQGIDALENHQYDEAIEALTKVMKTNPNYKNVLQKLTEAQKLQDQKSNDENLANIYARGIGYMNRGDWDNAIIAFKQIEKSSPNYKDVRIRLEECKTKLDQSLQEEIYEKLYTAGISEYQKGNWAQAILNFEKVREWNPDYKSVVRWYREAQNKLNREGENATKNRFYILGKTDLNNGNWRSAILNFQQIIQMDPHYRDVYVLLRQAQDGLENEAKSKQLETYYTEGIEHFNNSEWLKAILAFERAQQIDSNYRDISEKVLAARTNLEKIEMAENLQEVSIQKPISKKESDNKWVMIGAILSALFIPMGVAFFIVPTTRAKWLLMRGNYQKAALLYESILLKKPDKVKLYPALANIYLLLNRSDKAARRIYEIALQMNISPQMKQRIDELTNQKYLDMGKTDTIESLEEQLKRELDNLRSS